MWTVCLFYSQNNKIMIIKHGRHTRYAKVCGLFFFLIVFFGCWLAGQTNSDHMGALVLVRACVIMSKHKKIFLSAEIHQKVSILCEQSAVTAPAVIFAVRRVNQPFEMSAPPINVTFTCPSTFKALSFKTLVASCPFTKPFCFYSNDTQYNICSIARLGDKKVTISGLRHSSPLEVFTKSGRD